MKNISNLGKKIVRQRDKTDDKQETLGAGFDYHNGNLKKNINTSKYFTTTKY